MAFAVAQHLPPEVQNKLLIVRVEVHRITKRVRVVDSIRNLPLGRAAVLIIDSSIHSGTSMLLISEYLEKRGAANIISYSLVLKRGSCFVPNYFGLVIDDTDRAFFELDAIPNNRLIERKKSFGYIRLLRANDVHRRNIRTGVKSIDSMTFGDMFYDATVRPSRVYLYVHRDEICGYVAFEKIGPKLFIDVVASAKRVQGKGVGSALARWAETWARSCDCQLIELWAIKDRIGFYANIGFKEVPTTQELVLSATEKYMLMRKPILYNTPSALT